MRSAWGEDTLVPKEEPKKQAVIDEALEKNITGYRNNNISVLHVTNCF